ncbi:MAG: triosephosphate isomerase [Pseudomonadota bacterium]|jgi:triosephosphate isomerase
MSTRRPLIAGNWKMNQGDNSGREQARAVASAAAQYGSCDLVLSPPLTILAAVVEDVKGSSVGVAAQNVHEKDSGAYTGEVSVGMLKAAGAGWVIIGHSERRQYFGETDASVAAKTTAALAGGLIPIVCVGETLDERRAGKTLDVVSRQTAAFLDIIAAQPGVAAVAYEPVWAIGTGEVATPEQAQEVHAAIRAQLAQKSSVLAEKTRILYGGSVKGSNAASLLSCADIDGALVGGASLKAEDLLAIAAHAR